MNTKSALQYLLEASLIVGVTISKWGATVTVSCRHLLPNSPDEYELVFNDCHKLSWEVYGEENLVDLEADIIGFSDGLENHQEAAIITTDIFELSILYGGLNISQRT